MQELHNPITYLVGYSPLATATADNTAAVSAIIDCQPYTGALEFIIITGTLADADATFTVLVEHSDASNLSPAEAVPDSALIGTEADASFTFAADGAIRKIGYKLSKRYVRLTITPANNAGAAPMAVIVAAVKKHGD